MARYHCRCRVCETRKVLPKHPDEYRREPQCPHCFARSWRPDAWMNKRDTSLKGMGCICDGYYRLWNGPHRKGSKYCYFRRDGTQRVPGDPDFTDREMSDDEIAAIAAQTRKGNEC